MCADRQAVMAAAVDRLVAADRELDQLGRHRLAHQVDEVRAPAVRPRRDLHAVADRGLAGRDVEADVERRLVARVIVGRQEVVREIRLPGRRRARAVDEERRGHRVIAVGLRRHRGVARRHEERVAPPDRPARRDHDVLADAPERRRPPVDGHAADALAREVEVEAR
jgi:hypothetical protein